MSAPLVTELPMRRLDLEDLPRCVDLARDRDWPDETPKWRVLFDVGEVYGVDAPDGGLAACVVLTVYGTDLAVIGMMVVASRYGRLGLGQRLMARVIERASGVPVLLTATRQGRPLYERLGFQVVDHVFKHIGHYRPGPGAGVREAVDSDWEAIVRRDSAATGAQRTALLERLAPGARVLERDGRLAGHALAWRSTGRLVIGPLAGEDDDTAMALIDAMAAEEDGPIRLDLPSRFADLSARLREQGLSVDTPDPVMVLGDPPRIDHPGPYAWCMQATG